MFGKCAFRLLAFGDWEPMLLVLLIFWSFGRLMPAAPVHKADRETAAPSATMQNGISLMPAAPGHKADRVTTVPSATMQKGIALMPAAPVHKADREIVAPLAAKQKGNSLALAAPEHKRTVRSLLL